MKTRGIWIGSAVLLGIAVAALWVRVGRNPSPPAPETAAETPSAVAPAEPRGSAPARIETDFSGDLKTLPPEVRAQVEAALKGSGATNVRIASVSAEGARGRNNLQWLFTPPDPSAPSWQREVWKKHMAPLLYPQGHPRAGQWRDNVSPQDVEVAAQPLLEAFMGADYLDQPMLHVPEKRIDFNELNQAASRIWRRDDPSTAPAFYDWLSKAKEDPNAHPSDFWLPAPAGHPDATTQRAWLSEQIKQQVAEQIQSQGAAGS